LVSKSIRFRPREKNLGSPTKMEIRKLGKTDISIFAVGIGTGTLGAKTTEDVEIIRSGKGSSTINHKTGKEALVRVVSGMIDAAKKDGSAPEDAKILIDTAAMYGDRRSERIIGEVLKEHPEFIDWVLVTTKTGRTYPDKIDYSKDGLLRSIEESRKLTGIERFRIVYLHDPMDLPEKTVYEAREFLLKENVANHIGIAANDPDTNQKYIESGLFPAALIPETTSLINRRIENGILQAAEKNNIGLVAATVIEKGYLTSNPPPRNFSVTGRTITEECFERIEQIRNLCDKLGIPILAAAVQWPTYKYAQVTTSLIGISIPKDAEEAVVAATITIPDPAWKEIEKLATHFEGQRITK
jgi:D-threo-aldose 1-dehydrogenase